MANSTTHTRTPRSTAMLYPLCFVPRLKERIWGGRKLADLYGRQIAGPAPIGESWEVSDRPGDESEIANGPLAGHTLRWVMENHGRELFGRELPSAFRFPWLAKILDAREDLSLQVHPPAEIAPQLRGEPKTEIWYIAAAEPGACLYVGLRQGATREEFERRIADGTVAECFHRVPVKVGDVMFLPSGRVHALGGGIVLFEIQQNSDTTYRVFDWNRVGLDGRPRELHISQSLASIDFSDIEPTLVPDRFAPLAPGVEVRELVEHPAFKIVLHRYQAGARLTFPAGKLRLVASVDGSFCLEAAERDVELAVGGFGLLPAAAESTCSTPVGGQLMVVEEASAA